MKAKAEFVCYRLYHASASLYYFIAVSNATWDKLIAGFLNSFSSFEILFLF